jgi:Amt family ammonium transporter
MGALDFAGGLVVHVTAGATGLAVTLVLGRRRGWPDVPMRPHNLPLVVLGAFLLWFGWFGFNAGSALRPDAVAASAVVTSNTAAAAGVLGWTVVERLRYGRPTLLGAVSGGIAGLVAVTPCSGYVTPLSGLLVGLAAGLVCAGAVSLKVWFGVDDSLDVVAVHLVGGAVGTLALGLLATRDVNPSGRDGLFYGGGYDLLAAQALALLVVAVFAFTASYVLAGVLDRLIGNRVRPRDEDAGLDLALHGETAYSGLELAADATEASPQERSVRR